MIDIHASCAAWRHSEGIDVNIITTESAMGPERANARGITPFEHDLNTRVGIIDDAPADIEFAATSRRGPGNQRRADNGEKCHPPEHDPPKGRMRHS
jgi:hypothetical protein